MVTDWGYSMCTIVKNSILDDVANLHMLDFSNHKIASLLGISNKKVRKLLIANGITPKSKVYNTIRELYDAGYTKDEIASLCNVKLSTVCTYLPYSRSIYGLENPSKNALYHRKRKLNLNKGYYI